MSGCVSKKVQLRRWPGLFQQRAQVAQAPGAVMQGFLGGAFQRLDGVLLRQRQQAVQDPDANGTALLDHPFSPTASVRADQPGAIQQISLAMFDDPPIRGMQMVPIRGELPRFDPHMNFCAGCGVALSNCRTTR